MPEFGGIFIKKGLFQEAFDYEVFRRPFDTDIWIVLFSSSLILSICIVFILRVTDQTISIFPNGIKALFTFLQTNLGNASFATFPNELLSSKIIFFITLLMGNIVWMAYQGSLLSELIVPKLSKPFHDFDTLIKTNYR